MKNFTLIIGAVYGMLSVILGAFGAHAFKKVLSLERLTSFETGVKYQMYHALLLLIIGFFFKFDTGIEKWASWCISLGVIFFEGVLKLRIRLPGCRVDIKEITARWQELSFNQHSPFVLLIYLDLKQNSP